MQTVQIQEVGGWRGGSGRGELGLFTCIFCFTIFPLIWIRFVLLYLGFRIPSKQSTCEATGFHLCDMCDECLLYLEVSQSVQGDTAQPELGRTRVIRHTVLINISMFDG